MKRLMSLLFTLFIAITLLTLPAMAAESSTPAVGLGNTTDNKYYYDEDVTWLGTATEYQKTLNVFFDSGLRKVEVNSKYGLVNRNGAFVAQPVYDPKSTN